MNSTLTVIRFGSLCLASVSLLLCAAAAAQARDTATDTLGLVDFVARSLMRSDQVLEINDAIASAELDTAAAQHQFRTELVPLANIGASTASGTLGMGLEARRQNEFGTTMTVGVLSEKISSDNFVIENSHSTRAFVRLSQSLLRRWGRDYNRMGLTVAELEQRKTQVAAHSARQDLILSAAQAYYQAVLARQLMVKTAQALERRREHLEAAKSRQSVGLVSMADVYRAELALLEVETSLRDQERAWALRMDELYELLASENNGSLHLDEAIGEMTPVVMVDWEERLLEYRPDWRVHLIERQISSLSRFKAERDLRPDLSLNLMLEQQGLGESFEDSGDLDDTNWSVQLRLDSTIGRVKEKIGVQRERIRTRQLVREGDALKRRIRRDAQQAFDELRAAHQRHVVSGERLEQAEKGLELSRIRYQRGLSSNLEVLDSEVAFTNAELDILRTLMDYNIAAMRLAHALGVLDIDWIKASLAPIEDSEPAHNTDVPG